MIEKKIFNDLTTESQRWVGVGVNVSI